MAFWKMSGFCLQICPFLHFHVGRKKRNKQDTVTSGCFGCKGKFVHPSFIILADLPEILHRKSLPRIILARLTHPPGFREILCRHSNTHEMGVWVLKKTSLRLRTAVKHENVDRCWLLIVHGSIKHGKCEKILGPKRGRSWSRGTCDTTTNTTSLPVEVCLFIAYLWVLRILYGGRHLSSYLFDISSMHWGCALIPTFH